MKSASSSNSDFTCSATSVDRAADAALAERGRGEQQHHRAVASSASARSTSCMVSGGTRVSICSTSPPTDATVGVWTRIARSPGPGHLAVARTVTCVTRGDQPAVQLRDCRDHVAARARERNLGDVDRPRRVRVLDAVLAAELRLRPRSGGSARRKGRARSRRARATTYSRTSRPPIWRLPRSNRANAKRLRPGSSTLTLGASSGPCWSFSISTRMLRFDGSREVDVGRRADGRSSDGPEASLPSSPQPAATSAAATSATAIARAGSALRITVSRYRTTPAAMPLASTDMVRGVRLPLQTQRRDARGARAQRNGAPDPARTGSRAPASRCTAGAPPRPARSRSTRSRAPTRPP